MMPKRTLPDFDIVTETPGEGMEATGTTARSTGSAGPVSHWMAMARVT
jgi:hypothetical protein